jgi:hypothetical protein
MAFKRTEILKQELDRREPDNANPPERSRHGNVNQRKQVRYYGSKPSNPDAFRTRRRRKREPPNRHNTPQNWNNTSEGNGLQEHITYEHAHVERALAAARVEVGPARVVRQVEGAADIVHVRQNVRAVG